MGRGGTRKTSRHVCSGVLRVSVEADSLGPRSVGHQAFVRCKAHESICVCQRSGSREGVRSGFKRSGHGRYCRDAGVWCGAVASYGVCADQIVSGGLLAVGRCLGCDRRNSPQSSASLLELSATHFRRRSPSRCCHCTQHAARIGAPASGGRCAGGCTSVGRDRQHDHCIGGPRIHAAGHGLHRGFWCGARGRRSAAGNGHRCVAGHQARLC